MLWDSQLHKDDLVNNLHGTGEALGDGEFEGAEEAGLAAQEFFFWATFTMRKLADSFKLSDELLAKKWPVNEHPKRPGTPAVDFLNWDEIDKHYDRGRQQTRRLTLRQLCGLSIHSFVFLPVFAEDGLSVEGFFLNSDRTRERGVLFVPWALLRELIDGVYDDDIVRIVHDRRSGKTIRSSVPMPDDESLSLTPGTGAAAYRVREQYPCLHEPVQG